MEFPGKFLFPIFAVACLYFVISVAVFSTAATRPLAKGHKVKITGPIVVHDGDVVQILDGKDGTAYSFRVTDRTALRCSKGFLRGSTAMDASALVPALTVEVEGIASVQDVAEARSIKFNPDTFAFTATPDTKDVCRRPAQDLGRTHGVKTLFSSLLPM